MARRFLRIALATGVSLCAILAGTASAQQVLLGQGVRAADLWCFPLAEHPKEYVYLPQKARLARDEEGHPHFSFVRYVVNTPSTDAGSSSLTQAGGGGILHFIVLYDTAKADVDAAQAELRRRLDDKEVKLNGPIVADEGRYALVSSILNPATQSEERKLLASGSAPVLEGNRLAFSFNLDPKNSSLLLESFKMTTPDVSLVFDLTFRGLTEAYDAELTIDWSEVQKHQSFGAGGSVYFIGADVETVFGDLFRSSAIKLRSSGNDASTEALLNTVYGKLLELMFKRVEPESVPQSQRGNLVDAIGSLINPRGGALSSRNTTGFGAYVGYQLKDLRTKGTSVMSFNHRATVERHSYITFNIGDFYQRYGDNEKYFRTVNLIDPTFQQREIHVGIDGALLKDFQHYINTATVTLRKKHADGKQTLQELVLDSTSVHRDSSEMRMVYGWSGDDDRLSWLQYQYRTRWSFKGGGTYETEWVDSNAPMIDLFAPFERRNVQLIGDPEALAAKGVRAVIVQIEYPFFDMHRREQLVYKLGDDMDDKRVEITLPQNQFEYDTTITWQLEGGKRLVHRATDGSGLVFVDEIPGG